MFLGKTKWGLKIVLMAYFVTIAAAPVASQTPWTGNGGRGIRLTVLEPVGKGLSENEAWMPSLVQGSMTSDFNRYSAMTIIDRQNLVNVHARCQSPFLALMILLKNLPFFGNFIEW